MLFCGMFTSIGIDLKKSRWFGDLRLSHRLGHIVTQLFHNFGHSLPQSMGNKHQTKAAYNFMINPKVDVEGLYSSDAERVTERITGLEGQTYLAISHDRFGSLTHHRFVHVMDREGDIFEVFSARRYDHIHVLCRLQHNRKVIDNDLRIKELVREQTPIGELEITFLDRRTGNPKATGVRALWKGLRDFDLIYQAFRMMINWT